MCVCVWVCVCVLRGGGEGDDAGFQLFFLRAPRVVLGGRGIVSRARENQSRCAAGGELPSPAGHGTLASRGFWFPRGHSHVHGNDCRNSHCFPPIIIRLGGGM